MKDHMETADSFDHKTAKPYLGRVAGTPHDAYKDSHGNICLVCRSSSTRGGASLAKKALEWLDDQAGKGFVRFINSHSKWDHTVARDQLPEKPWQRGPSG